MPESGQRVRLRAGRGRWRGTFRAVSWPYTDETGEVVVRVAKEGEYLEAVREGLRAVGIPWPVAQIEVTALFEGDEERTQELPQISLKRAVEPRLALAAAQELTTRPWWRKVFGR